MVELLIPHHTLDLAILIHSSLLAAKQLRSRSRCKSTTHQKQGYVLDSMHNAILHPRSQSTTGILTTSAFANNSQIASMQFGRLEIKGPPYRSIMHVVTPALTPHAGTPRSRSLSTPIPFLGILGHPYSFIPHQPSQILISGSPVTTQVGWINDPSRLDQPLCRQQSFPVSELRDSGTNTSRTFKSPKF